MTGRSSGSTNGDAEVTLTAVVAGRVRERTARVEPSPCVTHSTDGVSVC